MNLSKQLEVKGQKVEDSDPDMVSEYFPSFLWVVRDFSLKLQDEFKNVISSKQYLENALKEQRGTSDAAEKKNKIRRLIQNYFKEKDCFTMIRPTEDERDLQNVQSLDDSQLRKEFVNQMQNLRHKVFKRVKPKRMNGRVLTGQMFLELCQTYTESINKGSVPSINSAWNNLCKNENQRAVQEAIRSFQSTLECQSLTTDPKTNKKCMIDMEQLKSLNKRLQEEMLEQFKSKALGEDTNELSQKITSEVTEIYQQFK